MGTTLDPGGYDDCYDLFDKALASERGVRMKFFKYGAAYNFRQRMNRARQLDRENNRRIHADNPGHPEYGKSKFSPFSLTLDHDAEQECWWLNVRRMILNENLVEEIPPDDDFRFDVETETGLDLSGVEEIGNETEGAS